MDLLKMTGRVVAVTIVFYFLMFFGISLAHPTTNTNQQEEPGFSKKVVVLGGADYNWILKTLDGQDFDFQQAKGKIVFINIWATWCSPCVEEMPSFQKLYNQFKDEVIFVFASDEESETLTQFLKEYNYSLPVYIYKQKPSIYDTLGIPVTFIISPNGKIVHKEVGGPVDWSTKKTIDFLRNLKK